MNNERKNYFHPRADCRLCGSQDLAEVFSFGATPLANAYVNQEELSSPSVLVPLVVNFCNACYLVQLRDVVDPDILFSHYLYASSTSPVFVAHFAQYAKQLIERFSLTSDSLVVDVGSNDGVLLRHFKNNGVKILGIEPAKNLAVAAQQSGIPTVAQFFTTETATAIKKEHGKASIITANNVFAHTDDVVGFARSVKELLAPEGVFVFEVQYLKDLIERNLFDMVYHEHLLYYHLTPLVPFFTQQGLRIIDVEHVETHGGSIRVYVGFDMGPHPTTPAVGEMVRSEVLLNDPLTYKKFAERIKVLGDTLRAFLSDATQRGKSVVGFGAPAKATTLCYALGIDKNMLRYIVDDSPLKQGLYMPGTHIPIKPSTELYTDAADYCLILAWNFADSIVKNHQKFIQNGGMFVLPVPELRIL